MRLYLFLLLSLLAFGGDDIYQSALQAKGRSEADLTRDETSKPAEVMAFAKVQPGMKVLDILGGGGYYSELLAAVVGE
ncbi:MAG: hypothetical protein KDC71_03810, partial [Acidobacteria bacterium]|nr:hypothetical protein [Acidobacteriota bacterium]